MLPANLELSAMEMMLVTTMSRETVMRTYLNKVKDDYEYILIDCMPSLGMVTLNALAAADSVIIPRSGSVSSRKRNDTAYADYSEGQVAYQSKPEDLRYPT